MKVKLSEIKSMVKAIQNIAYQKIPVKMALKISSFVKELGAKNDVYEDTRIKLCLMYCEKDAEGKPVVENNVYKGLTENVDFTKEFATLNEETVDVAFDGISISALEKEGVKLSIADAIALESILVD